MKKTIFLVCAVMILALVPGCKWPFGKKEAAPKVEVHAEVAHVEAPAAHEDVAHHDAHAVETPHKI